MPLPNHITRIRERRSKLAKCYDGNGVVPEQWEVYDLQSDPLEVRNIAAPGTIHTPEEERLRSL